MTGQSKKIAKALCISILLAAAPIGCAKGHSYKVQMSEKHSARLSASEIEVLYANPTKEFKKIGVLEYEAHRTGRKPINVSELAPKLQEKVQEVGGDAIILRSKARKVEKERYLKVVGDVIRYVP